MSSPQPRQIKRVHHVVPASWQRRFFLFAFGARDSAGYYKDIVAGRCLGPEGPGEKMAEEYVNLVFDDVGQPSNLLEDRIGSYENKAIPALDRMVASKQIDPRDRVDLAFLIALQACRYPELFHQRLDLARYLAIALGDIDGVKNASELNERLQDSQILPGAVLSDADFQSLKSSSPKQREQTVNHILEAHGYEGFMTPGLVIDGALPVAEHIIAQKWDLLETKTPSFLLSDRPVPARKLGNEFSVPLTDCFALRISNSLVPTTDTTVASSRPAAQTEIDELNRATRDRAVRWICGPAPWVHQW
jgi:hypothetical protein